MENIVIEEKQSKILKSNVIGLLVTILCIAILLFGIRYQDLIMKLVGVIGAFFFSICTIYNLSRAIHPKALLTITLEGVEDSSSASSVGFMSFQDIKCFEIVNVFGQRMIGVIPNNAENFINKLPQIKQKSARSNMKMKMPPVALRVDTARDISIEDILTLLQKRLMDYSSLYN